MFSRMRRGAVQPLRRLLSGQVQSVDFLARHTAAITYVGDEGRSVVDTRLLSQDRDREIWMKARAALDSTASEFSCAGFDESPFKSRASLLESKVARANTHVDNAATRFGRDSEPLAVAQYAEESGNDVHPTGLWTDEELRFGASPDGIVVDGATGQRGLLEVKCFFSRRNQRSFPVLKEPPGRFVAQIQGQLAVCDLDWCDLVCWIPKNSTAPNYRVIRVQRDLAYWDDLRPRLLAFSRELRDLRARARADHTHEAAR